MNNTVIQYLGYDQGYQLYCKREDLIPFSFGGNKARKGILFFQEIDKDNYDCVVTYGSSHSNHCRIISNLAASRKIPCYIIGPKEVSGETFNSKFMDMFGAKIDVVPVEQVHETIETKIEALRKSGKNPFFIPGGGHGNIGTKAYVDCYEEIMQYETEHKMFFDYIFLASGTGTTQAGLVCGQIIHKEERKIIGISIARRNPRGRNVIIDSIKEYLPEVDDGCIQNNTIFIDDYVGRGYAEECVEIKDVICDMMVKHGIPLDSTYTGKAYYGMKQYLKKEKISGKKILFIHTGGTPLFFDDLRKL